MGLLRLYDGQRVWDYVLAFFSIPHFLIGLESFSYTVIKSNLNIANLGEKRR